MAAAVAEAFATVRPDTSKFGGELTSKLGGLKSAAMTAGLGIAGGLAVATGVAFKIGSEFHDATNTIRVGTGATGKQLEGLKDSFRDVVSDVPASFADASTAVADINTKLGLTGKPLEGLSGQFLDLARITKGDVAEQIRLGTRVFGDWDVATEHQSGTLDKLFRAAQASGAGIESLMGQVVQFGSPLRGMGFSLEESVALFAKFEKEGVNAELVIGSLRQGLGRMAKAGEDAPATFRRVVDEISGMESRTEATAAAMELFGARAGPDMAAAIQEGRFSIEEMLKAIESGEDTIGAAAKDTEGFSESWQRFKNRAMLALEPIATRVFKGLSDGMERLAAFWGKHGEKITAATMRIGEVVGAVFSVIGDVFAWISDQVALVSGIISNPDITSDGWIGFVERVVVGMMGLVDTIRGIFDTIVGLFRGSSDLMGGATGGLLADIMPIWQQITGVIGSAVDAIVGIVSWGVGVITEFWDRFGTHILSFLQATWDNVMQVIGGALDVIQGIFEVFAGIFTGNWGRAWDGVKKILSGVWNVIVGTVKQAINLVKTVIGGAMAAISQVWKTVWDRIKSILSGAWDAIKSGVTTGIANVVGFFRELPGKIMSALAVLAAKLLHWARGALSEARRGAVDGASKLIAFVRELPGRILKGLGNLGRMLLQAGRDIIQGLINGITGMAGKAVDAVVGVGRSIKNSITGFFGLSSPSKLFAGYGRNLMEGFVEGIGQRTGLVEAAVGELAALARAQMQPALAELTRPFAVPRIETAETATAGGRPAGGPQIMIAEGAIRITAADPRMAGIELRHTLDMIELEHT